MTAAARLERGPERRLCQVGFLERIPSEPGIPHPWKVRITSVRRLHNELSFFTTVVHQPQSYRSQDPNLLASRRHRALRRTLGDMDKLEGV